MLRCASGAYTFTVRAERPAEVEVAVHGGSPFLLAVFPGDSLAPPISALAPHPDGLLLRIGTAYVRKATRTGDAWTVTTVSHDDLVFAGLADHPDWRKALEQGS